MPTAYPFTLPFNAELLTCAPAVVARRSGRGFAVPFAGIAALLMSSCQAPSPAPTTAPQTTMAAAAAAPSPVSSPALSPTARPSPTVTLTPVPSPTATPVPPTPTVTPTPRPPFETRVGQRQIAPPGGIGNTLADFRQAFGPGEQQTGPQTTYQFAWQTDDRVIRVQFWLSTRAGGLRVELPRSGEPLERSYVIARGYLPYDAVITRHVTATLQHVRSQQFGNVMPDELLGANASPGDLFVRYNVTGELVNSITIGSGHPNG